MTLYRMTPSPRRFGQWPFFMRWLPLIPFSPLYENDKMLLNKKLHPICPPLATGYVTDTYLLIIGV